MTQIFLTSTVSYVAHDMVKHIDLTTYKRLAFIDTAAEVEEGDKKWLEEDRQSLVKVGFDVINYTLTGKNSSQLKSDLDSIDVIYVSGGNTFYLLQQAQQSGFIDIVREYVLEQGKPYISTSAGSIVAGPDIYPSLILDKLEKAPLLDGYQGFNLVNFCVMPHWGSNTFKDLYLNRRLEHAYHKQQVPLMILTDFQYVHVKDGWNQVVRVEVME